MATNSVHFPADLAGRLDRVAKRKQISRNKLIVQACEQYLASDQQDTWPCDFFAVQLNQRDLQELQRGADEIDTEIAAGRHSKTSPPF